MKIELTKILAGTASCALAVGLTGCAGETGKVAGTGQRSGAGQSQAPDSRAQSADSAKGNPKFGETYEWDDGLAVTVSAPERATPPEYHDIKGTPLVFTITVTNGTSENLDSVMFSSTLVSGEQQARDYLDMANGIDLQTATVLPSNSFVYKVAFDVADPSNLQLSWNPGDFKHGKVHFVS